MDGLAHLVIGGAYSVDKYQELRNHVGTRSPGIWKDRTAMERTILEGDEEYEGKRSGEA